ncbi:hypothetical protein ES703_73560 [subsurface metagenome]
MIAKPRRWCPIIVVLVSIPVNIGGMVSRGEGGALSYSRIAIRLERVKLDCQNTGILACYSHRRIHFILDFKDMRTW